MAAPDGPGELQKAVGKGRLAVVDMGDDGEVPDPLRRIQAQVGGGVGVAGVGAEGGGGGEIGEERGGRVGTEEERADVGTGDLGGAGYS